MSRRRIILASQSPRRHELLNLIGLAHDVIPAHADERMLEGELPPAHAERLAREKAAAVAARFPDDVVIGADTIVLVDGDVLGKPADVAHARAMLRRLSGRPHRVITGVAVHAHGTQVSGIEVVDVRMRDLTDAVIEAYVATGEPMDKAGAYGIQGYGAVIVERIEGDFFAVMGLALGLLIRLLESVGVPYSFGSGTGSGQVRV